MKLVNKILGCIVLIIGFSTTALAAYDPNAKEETTPPPAEGPLTLQQTPPIMNIGKPLETPAPAATHPAPTATNQEPAPTAQE